MSNKHKISLLMEQPKKLTINGHSVVYDARSWCGYYRVNYRVIMGLYEERKGVQRARDSVIFVLLTRNLGHQSQCPYDIVKIIAQYLWSTRYDKAWRIHNTEELG